jgi:hypothetical protein
VLSLWVGLLDAQYLFFSNRSTLYGEIVLGNSDGGFGLRWSGLPSKDVWSPLATLCKYVNQYEVEHLLKGCSVLPHPTLLWYALWTA